MAFWRFSTRNHNRTIREVFGIAKFTNVKIVQEATCELVNLSSELIKFHLTTLEHVTATMPFVEYIRCKIPQIVGTINKTHIEILPPESERKADYCSRKQNFTIHTKAVTGTNLRQHL